MHVSDGIHHVPQGGPRELGLGLKTYMCTVCTISSFLMLFIVNIILQVLKASFVPRNHCVLKNCAIKKLCQQILV